ncbi:MAG: hypothetical protein NTW29_20090 [Bacteroidetes bacterium]|nr:hypothetical protein [Bacteroidota bacterium]
MTIPQTKQIINLLRQKGVVFADGLSDSEVENAEDKFKVKFPPDLKQFLQLQLPISDAFVDWRKGLYDQKTEDYILELLAWPLEGILWDIKHGEWLSIWGECPENKDDQITIAKSYFAAVPQMVPVFSHRYIPSEPNEAGNPIFSVHQTDIIYYGYDLARYFAHEFQFKLNEHFTIINKPNRRIEFWSWCVENMHP